MSAISKNAKTEIIKQISIVVEKYLRKASESPSANSGNPFIIAMLKDFEPLLHRIHGLKTSFGIEMEKIAEIIAIESWGKENVLRKSKLDISLPQNVFHKIDTIMNGLNNVRFHPNYNREKNEILYVCNKPSKKTEICRYESDLQLNDVSKHHHYYLEMKGPGPNTTEVSGAKRRLLTFLAFGFCHFQTKKIDSIICIYYNDKYPNPYRDPKVLNYFDPAGGMKVHDEFWNFIGRNPSTYKELLNLFESYGKNNKKRIWEGFSKLIDLK